jgi:hypothetical protein
MRKSFLAIAGVFAAIPLFFNASASADNFNLLYPDYYIKALNSWQNLVYNHSNLLPQKYSFKNEGEVISFLDTFIEFDRQMKFIDDKKASELKNDLHNNFLKEKEKEKSQWFQIKLKFYQYFQKISAAILPAKANAYLFQSFPYCYKGTGPAVPGVKLFSPFCNAGVYYAPNAVIFVPDCGTQYGCEEPLGCLNSVCATYPNAIWDSRTNGTNACGCG